jgi:hypothetical protein
MEWERATYPMMCGVVFLLASEDVGNRITLRKCLEKDAALLKSSLEELWSKAQEKSSWRGTVVALCTSRCGKTQV